MSSRRGRGASSSSLRSKSKRGTQKKKSVKFSLEGGGGGTCDHGHINCNHDHGGDGGSEFPKQKRRRVEETKANVTKVASMSNPNTMGFKKLTTRNDDFDKKDKRGASLAFRDKYNQYLDSRTETDDLDIGLIKNVPVQDLYSRNEDDMDDDEKLARFNDEDVDATVEKYKKMFQRHPRETISSVEKRKQMEKESKQPEGTFTIFEDDGGQTEITNERGNEVEVERTAFVLSVPMPASASTLSARHFSRLDINTNPYPLFTNWTEMQASNDLNFDNSRKRRAPAYVITVQSNRTAKTPVDAIRVFKNFFTSTKYLTLNMFLNGLKPIDVVFEFIERPNTDDKKRKSSRKTITLSTAGAPSTFVSEPSKMDAVKIFNANIEKGSGFKVKRTCNPIICGPREENFDFETTTTTTTTTETTSLADKRPTEKNLACTVFEKSYLAEDLDVLMYVYYDINLVTYKLTIDTVFYVLINLRDNK